MTSEKDEKKIPSFISKEFFKNALENGLKTRNIQIENYTISSIGGGGENYSSEIYSGCVRYANSKDHDKHKEIHLILKVIQIQGNSNELLELVNVFNIEKLMYLEIVPEMEKLIGDHVTIAPKCYYTSKSDKVLVFQDLRALGYKVQDRLIGLDEQHCAVVMRKLGQFHGTSMCIAKTDPRRVEQFDKGIFNEYTTSSKLFDEIFLANFKHMISVAEQWPGYERIALKLREMSLNLVEKGVMNTKLQEGEIRVLNHGDLWLNNILFKHDDNNSPCDAAFVDLQISVYGSPGIDINYFLNLSAKLDVLKTKRSALHKVYYESLKRTLEKLNYTPIPLWDDIAGEIRGKELYGLITLAGVFPIVSMDRSASQDNSLQSFEDSEIAQRNREIMFSSERLLETFKYALKRYDEIGVLDE